MCVQAAVGPQDKRAASMAPHPHAAPTMVYNALSARHATVWVRPLDGPPISPVEHANGPSIPCVFQRHTSVD